MAVALVAFEGECRTAGDFFVEAPDSELPLLDASTRMDMLDYYTNGFSTPSRNAFEGSSRVLSAEDRRIEVQLSRDASLQIGVLPFKGDTILAVVETVLTPVADSSVRFYHKDWTPVAKQPAMPGAKTFLTAKTEASDMPDMFFVVAQFDPASGYITFRNTTAGYYTEHDRPQGLKQMRSSVTMRYDGKKYVEVPGGTGTP